MNKDQKIRSINSVVKNYFDTNPHVQKVVAKDLMPLFIQAGIFKRDYKNGLPLRNLFRDMDANNELGRIPFLLAERKTKNTNWFFIRSNKVQNKPKPKKTESATHQSSEKTGQVVLHDLLKTDLEIVFCGTAVGNKSAGEQAYYAGPGNKFYSILHQTGLTPIQLQPAEYKRLLDYNIGLTDMVKKVSGNDNVLNDNDFDVDSFIAKIVKYQPGVVCFNGKAATAVLMSNNQSKTGDVDYGWMHETIGKTKLFVAPSTSGSANAYWDKNFWFQLKKDINNG